MSTTSRDLVIQTLSCSEPKRAPRQLWFLPWAERNYADYLKKIKVDFPSDIEGVPGVYRDNPKTEGNPFEVGIFQDEWGCIFENLQPGIIGEVKKPLVNDWNTDIDKIHIPYEWLTLDINAVNDYCKGQETFLMAGACPRPFEQLQFIRGTENLYIDIMEQPPSMMDFIKKMHLLYCESLQLWAKTEVDSLMFMDDWGSQKSLLINPGLWRSIFKPMYSDYIEIAHAAGKKIFMHSDGHILQIMPDLIEIGLDAINAQLFCMGPENLAPFAGNITFWGEIDRQYILVKGTTTEVHNAVKRVYDNLWRDGGCIAQCEFGPGAKPENVYQVFVSWNTLTQR